MEVNINLLAVGAAVVANFILGFLWYAPLFGKAWAREMGFDPNEKAKSGEMAKGMIFMIIGNFLLAYVFAHNIAAWSFVPGAEQMSIVENTASSAFFTWLGFFLPQDLGIVTWERKSWKLFGINTSYHLLMLLVAAICLTHIH
jgi:hypothetical protein